MEHNPWLLALAMILSGLPATISAVAALIAALRSARASERAERAVNGRVDDLSDSAVLVQDAAYKIVEALRAAKRLPPSQPPTQPG